MAKGGKLTDEVVRERMRWRGPLRDQKAALPPGAATKGARVGGRICREKRLGIFAPENQEKRKAGNAIGGQAGGPIGGKIGGKIAKEQELGIFHPELEGYGSHVRWHVNRGIINPKCAFCCDPSLTPELGQYARKPQKPANKP